MPFLGLQNRLPRFNSGRGLQTLEFMKDHDPAYFPLRIEQPPAFFAVIVCRIEKPSTDPILRGLPRPGFVTEAGRNRRMAIGFAADTDDPIRAYP